MRVLVLGGSGMLGRALVRELARHHEVLATVRGSAAEHAARDPLLGACRLTGGLDARSPARVDEALASFRPAAVVNAIGIVKQREEGTLALPLVEINALFPHRLAALCREHGARLVHSSTDCVFSGSRGEYGENDPPDPVDLYGRSKLLGEPAPPCLTLRWSLVGLEGGSRRALVEWFLAQHGEVRGFRRSVFSGVTTAEAARLVHRTLVEWPGLEGIWHVAAAPISKLDLLTALGKRVRPGLRVLPEDHPVCDRSLDAGALARQTGYRPPSWPEMLAELALEIEAREAGR